jgi:hypothetical protein
LTDGEIVEEKKEKFKVTIGLVQYILMANFDGDITEDAIHHYTLTSHNNNISSTTAGDIDIDDIDDTATTPPQPKRNHQLHNNHFDTSTCLCTRFTDRLEEADEASLAFDPGRAYSGFN